MNKKLLGLILGAGALTLASCETPHVHTFDLTKWEITDTHHWRESTCEHEGLASNLGEHTYGSDGKCTVCGYQKQTSRFNFSLRSDYCNLNNKSVYDEGDEVELNLTLKEEFKSSLTLPNDVEVYSDGTLLTKGTDYTYVVEGETGKLSLKVNGNIVVLAFNDQNEDSFKITEAQFADAMNVSDETHLQYNLTAGFYSSFSIIMQQYDVEYSPNVTYRGSYSFDASRNGGSISCDYTYIEKENETYTEYHSDKSGIWTTRTTDEATFNGSKSLSLGGFPFISGFQLTYDRIKDNFNSVTNAYEVYFTYQEYNVKFEVTFYNGKLINVSYEGIFEADRGIFGNVDVSYIEKEVSISEAAKPHVHTFDTEWTTSETHHWHVATCSHTSEKGNYGAHTFDDSGVCTTCGYIAPNLYPVITKYTQSFYNDGSFAGKTVFNNVWADDLSQVIFEYEEINEKGYMKFNSNGRVIEDGDIVGEQENFCAKSKCIYNGDVLIEKLEYDYNTYELLHRYTYTYNNDGKIENVKDYYYPEETETLFEEINYTYQDNVWHEISTAYVYNPDWSTGYCDDKWTVTESGGNTKYLLERTNVEGNEYYEKGYVVYNDKEQLVEAEHVTSGEPTYSYITYNDNGNIETMIRHGKDDMGSKAVYSYDANGFIIDCKVFDYNEGEQEYNILSNGYDYVVDSHGTVIEKTYYKIKNNQKVTEGKIEAEVKYVGASVDYNYEGFVPETFGSYEMYEIDLIRDL